MSPPTTLALLSLLIGCNADVTATSTETEPTTTDTATTVPTTTTTTETGTTTTETGTTTTYTPEKIPKVLIIGFDGLRQDSMLTADTPTLDALIGMGTAAEDAHASDLTWSGPGWASILTGVWWDKHWVTENKPSSTNMKNYPDLFTRMKEAAPELMGASYISWLPINEYILTGADIMFEHDYHDDGDAVLLAQATTDLLDPTLDIDLMFVYFADIDIVGHDYGWDGDEYLDEVALNDTDVGVLIAALSARPTYDEEDWLIIGSSDHGGTGTGHGDDIFTHRNIPFIVSGAAVYPEEIVPAPNQTDIAVTALAHLGIDNDPSWDLDGRVVGITPSETFTPTLGDNLIRNGDAEATRPATDVDHNLELLYWTDWGQVTSYPYGLGPDWPSKTDPAPDDRGAAYFCGGYGDGNFIDQVIELDALAKEIDTGKLTFTLSGYLGGYSSQEDSAIVSVTLYGEDFGFETSFIGPVTASDRGNQTGLLFREATGEVPTGTRFARITLSTVLTGGSISDGYADNLSLVLQ